jgi:hypothetical protein
MRPEAAREGPGDDRVSHDCLLPACRNIKPLDAFSVTNSYHASIIIMCEIILLNAYTVAASVLIAIQQRMVRRHDDVTTCQLVPPGPCIHVDVQMPFSFPAEKPVMRTARADAASSFVRILGCSPVRVTLLA